MPATLSHYEQVAAAFPDTESLTVLTVAGTTRDQVISQLQVDLGSPVDDDWPDQEGTTSWAILEIPGGVLAVEITGFGDPSRADLVALSAGGAASVVRSNVLGHYRFGWARAGELEFDADEYLYIEDPNTVPDELQDLFRLVYDDLAEEADDSEDRDPFALGLAMCEVVTGLKVSAEQVQQVLASGFFAAPSMRYPTELEREAEATGGSAPFSDDIPRASEEGRAGPSPSHWLVATEGVYAIGGEFPGTFSDPPGEWPTDAFCVAVDPGTAWVRKLSTQPGTRIRPTAVYAETEPTTVLQEAAEVYEHQTSAVLNAMFGDALRVYDSDFAVRLYLTKGPAIYQLRVFAKLPDEEHDYEQHLLVAWPDPNAQPDVHRSVQSPG